MSGEVQQVDPGKDDQESTQQRDRVDGIRGVESLEEDERGAKRGGGKRDIVQRVDTVSRCVSVASFPSLDKRKVILHRCRKLVQGLVKVVHLGQDAETGDNGEDISRGMRELVIPAQGQFHGNAKRLDGHDGDGADGRADGDVDKRVLLPIHRSYPVDHHGRVDGHR